MFEELEREFTRISDGLASMQEEIGKLRVRIDALEAGGPKPDPDPDPDPDPIPDPAEPLEGLWLSKEELEQLPTSGPAWDEVFDAANSSWGAAALHDNNSQHDVKVLAGALAAARLDDGALRGKVIDGLKSATKSDTSRALELGRGLQSYIIAADLIGYSDPTFEAWIEKVVEDREIQGHSGDGLIGTAVHSATNWGGHARASLAAAALYLGRQDWLDTVIKAQKEMLGLPVEDPQMKYTDTSWHANSKSRAGINRKGATINGVNVSGVLPEDWRRAGDFKWPPGETGYQWEGMQGLVVTAVLLDRADLIPFDAGNDAIVRAMDMLYGLGEAASNSPVFKSPASGDDRWIPWLVNHYAGTNYPTEMTDQPGKGMGYIWAFLAR